MTVPTATLAATVTSCLDDGGPGTLRSIIAVAAEAETVDFAGLDCTAVSSTITLSGSSILIAQYFLTIEGPGAPPYQLSIDASALPRGFSDSRVFTHGGTGTLTLTNLILKGGYVSQVGPPSFGGCLSSAGNVSMNAVTVTQCQISHTGGSTPTGGAVFVSGDLAMQNSIVSYSSATGNAKSAGGGVYVSGDLSVHGLGSINNNSAKANTGTSLGGGAYVKGNLILDSGGVFSNSADSIDGSAKGGGAYVIGNLNASNGTFVALNSATSNTQAAKGGGVYTKGDLTLQASVVTSNTVNGGSLSLGGGAFVIGDDSTSYTTVKYNKAYGSAIGGGLYLKGATNTIASSTISNNTSYIAAGVAVLGGGTSAAFELKNSTISSNHASALGGGLLAYAANVNLFNSTIAFNTAGEFGGVSPGVELRSPADEMAANLQSTLISNNSVGTYQLDLHVYPNSSFVTFNGGALATPANNFIRATKLTNLPTDTKQGFCPHLGPLRDNGGLTYTHALMSRSVAIDAGNDSSLLALHDQRGSAAVNGTVSYSRLSGTGGIADIGAHEVQQNDIVFNTDFEDCPPLAF